MTAAIKSFLPALDEKTEILILGSMPGAESLARSQYYAHPRNRFWPLMEKLFGAGRMLPYKKRIAALNRVGVGLWDVIKICRRRGSLDSEIVASSEKPNDFRRLFRRYPSVRLVVFNGGKAAGAFGKKVLPFLPETAARRLIFIKMPSTSPANAGFSYARLLSVWRGIKKMAVRRRAGEIGSELRFGVANGSRTRNIWIHSPVL